MSRTELSVTNLGKEAVNQTDEFGQAVDRLCEQFPRGGSEGILPPHFLKATYPKIGGRIVNASNGESEYWGLLLPNNLKNGSEWTLRSFWVNTSDSEREALAPELHKSLSEAGYNLTPYEHATKSQEQFEGRTLSTLDNGIKLGEPSKAQAKQAQDLQQKVWGISDEAYLYPDDLYHPESGLATKLVATSDEEVVGFLFGFYGHGSQWYGTEKGFQKGQWLESQLMGINPDYRRMGIGSNLKLLQRKMAGEEGLEVIHWTVDPLQVGNAQLNMNSLGGVAVQHYKKYYPFTNALNRVAASRIGISWMVNSPRVEEHANGQAKKLDFNEFSSASTTEIVHPVTVRQSQINKFDTDGWNPSGDTILLEVPTDWNGVQAENIELAEAWRETTDDMFAKVLPKGEAPYAITGAVSDSEEKSYLVIQKADSNLGV